MSPRKALKAQTDSRFIIDHTFAQSKASTSCTASQHSDDDDSSSHKQREVGSHGSENEGEGDEDIDVQTDEEELGDGMAIEGFAGSSEKVVKPLTPEALAAYMAAQEKAGVVYISRIPPGMRPTKVRHLMSQHGEVGRVYLQPEDPKRAYLRRKYTSTKKIHFTEGWVEFRDKKVARSVAELLNAQSIGGKKGTRWRDDIWTMKYLPKFKWRMLTEQIAHEAAIHRARLQVELSQSRREQQEYLKNVELARVLDKRAERKRKVGDDAEAPVESQKKSRINEFSESREVEKRKKKSQGTEEPAAANRQLNNVLASIF